MSSTWVVYVLHSASRARTYVGITTDVTRRLAQHNGERPGGARSTRGGRPWSVAVCYGPYPSRGDALRAEFRVKRHRGRARMHCDEPRLDQSTYPVSSASAGPS